MTSVEGVEPGDEESGDGGLEMGDEESGDCVAETEGVFLNSAWKTERSRAGVEAYCWRGFGQKYCAIAA